MQAKTATTRQGRFKTTLVMSHPDTAATSIIRDLKQKHTLTPLGWDIETRLSEWGSDRVRGCECESVRKCESE
jgi:hypothetical protein